jgi:hypothetical protein
MGMAWSLAADLDFHACAAAGGASMSAHAQAPSIARRRRQGSALPAGRRRCLAGTGVQALLTDVLKAQQLVCDHRGEQDGPQALQGRSAAAQVR